MFEQLQIRIKRGNLVTGPEESWTSHDKFYCTGMLTAGFGETFVWDETNLLPLQKLVDFYHDLGLSTRSSAPTAFQYSFPCKSGSLQCHWTIQPHAQLNFTIYYREAETEREILAKPVDIATVISWMQSTYTSLLAQVAENAPPPISLIVGQLFSPGHEPGYRFSPGQKVRTVLTTYVRNLYIGYILHRERHDAEKNNCYQLLVDGRIIKKLYREDELEAMY